MLKRKCILFFIFLILFCNNRVFAQEYLINTIAGIDNPGFSKDSVPANISKLNYPISLCIDTLNNLFVADWGNSRIREINSKNIITTIAGNGYYSYSGDGGPAINSRLSGPSGIATDKHGNIYFTDIGNARIRKISPLGIITTIAGNGKYGYTGDGGLAVNASFKDPTGLSLDKSGNIFVTDVFNNVVRKINTSGIITTIAGNGVAGYSGDGGPAIFAQLYYPTGVAIDDSGNVYIADEDNNRIRKVNTNGFINTAIGSGTAGYSGDGGPATLAALNFPTALAIDNNNNIYVTDANNNRIRMVNPTGIISTIAGDGNGAFFGDGGLASAASLYNPTGISVDAESNIYISDSFNSRIRKLTKISRDLTIDNVTVTIYPNPSHGAFNILLQNVTGSNHIEIFNVLGEKIFSADLNQNNNTQMYLDHQSSGIYLYRIINNTKETIYRGKLIIL